MRRNKDITLAIENYMLAARTFSIGLPQLYMLISYLKEEEVKNIVIDQDTFNRFLKVVLLQGEELSLLRKYKEYNELGWSDVSKKQEIEDQLKNIQLRGSINEK